MRSTGCQAGLILPLILMCSACHASDPGPKVGFYKLDDARISGTTDLTAPEAGAQDLQVLVTVDRGGSVVAAEPVDNYQRLDTAPALAAVRQWRFRPQSFDGQPVVAVGMVTVRYHAAEIPADAAAPFPDATGKDVEIGLDRSACFGTCPDYRVTIGGDGTVRFATDPSHFAGTAAQVHLKYSGSGVLWPGTHVAHIDPKAVAALLDRFRAAHFFGLKKEYVAGVTDNATQRLTVRIGTDEKVVTDYVGSWVGMPRAVHDLEVAVDQVAGTDRWVDGNLDTLADLEAEGFDARSQAGAELAGAVAARLTQYERPAGADALLLALIDKGVPLGAPFGKTSLGAGLVESAAEAGDESLFNRLAATGQLGRMSRSELGEAFVHVQCSPTIAQALVKAGADPRTTGENGNALNGLTGVMPTCNGNDAGMVEMARTLIALGVPLEARNDLGWTPLMGCDSPELARLLLEHGANPNARSEDGTTPVLATDDDRVALVLLRAGADPHARNKETTLREQAVKQHMPATLAWLDEHGIR